MTTETEMGLLAITETTRVVQQAREAGREQEARLLDAAIVLLELWQTNGGQKLIKTALYLLELCEQELDLAAEFDD